MKFTNTGAIKAVLDLTIEMSARQKAFHETMISSLSTSDEEWRQSLQAMDNQVARNIELLRAKILQYSEIDQNDLLNGTFEI